MKFQSICFILIINLLPFKVSSQSQLTEELNKNAIRFTLKSDNRLKGEVSEFLSKKIEKAQFIGLAELHRSEQLSFFTVALLDLLSEVGYENLALEIGPYSAQYLQELSANHEMTQKNISRINRVYGNRIFGQLVPIIFADRKEDALFIKKAAEEGFNFWGLDQEFAYSIEMHLDTIYAYHKNPDQQLENQYLRLKKIIHKKSKKSVFSRRYDYYCFLNENDELRDFFDKLPDNPKTQKHIDHIYTSLDIYCQNFLGKNSNQQRADYMKDNFDYYYNSSEEAYPKVFVKLGSVHLTRGKSPYGVEDVGQYLREKAEKNGTGFVTIRHLRRYKNGKDYVGKKGWKTVSNFMAVGEKDRWSLIDLRPIRDKIETNQLEVTEHEKFEIYSYDLLVIPPNDHRAKKNF